MTVHMELYSRILASDQLTHSNKELIAEWLVSLIRVVPPNCNLIVWKLVVYYVEVGCRVEERRFCLFQQPWL